MSADPETLEVGLNELAALFEVTPKTITLWVKDGLPKLRHGRYPLAESIRWRLRKLREASQSDGGINEERRKLIMEQRRSHEIDNAAKAAELLPADEVATDIMAFSAIVAGQLDAMPQRLSSRLVSLTDPDVVRRVLTDECRSLRTAASQAFEAYGYSLAGGKDPGPAPGARRRRVGRRSPDSADGQPGTGAMED